MLCPPNHQYKADTVERFHRPQPTGGGRQLGLSSPVRTETVNTAKPPALLSGSNTGKCSERTHLSLPSCSPLIQQKKKAFSCLLVLCVRISEFNYRSLLATPVIFPSQSYALGASQCHTISPKWFLLWAASKSTKYICCYRTDLRPFSQPFCRNQITSHLG